MDHADHVRLLRDGVPRSTGTWADLGAGEGAFTLALADLLPPDATIHAIDQDRGALAQLVRAHTELAKRRPLAGVVTAAADFTRDLALPPLDGVVMANSLHFVKDKGAVLARVRALLRPGAPLLLVEYDTDSGNQWVPYPVSFETWRRVAPQSGFAEPRLLASHPSRFLRRIYSAGSSRPSADHDPE
jgi:ubiquinone/menaquinone biosynthesis C-methylase UbiE